MQVARRLVIVLASSLSAAPAAAQQFEIVHAFQAPLANAKAPLALAADGALYGTLAAGGQGGVGALFVTRPQADGSVLSTFLHQFERSEGGAVLDALVQGDGEWLYGVAPEHGAHARGTVFRFHRGTGQLVVLHPFSGPDGARPRGALVRADDGNYYGTTTAEGPGGQGTVFKLTAGNVLTTLHAFTDGQATGVLVQGSDHHLYGINGAQFFRLTLDGTRTVLHTIVDDVVPSSPIALALVNGVDGDFLGAFRHASGPLVFFRITRDGAYTESYRSERYNLDGDTIDLLPLFVAADGSLLGTLPLAGPNERGTLFRLAAGGSFTVLHSFTVAEGRSYSGIVRHANGHLYGTTADGSVTGHGMIYSVGPGGTIVVRQPFLPLLPSAPSAPPIEGPDGALYGTTVAGGTFNLGTVYRLTAAGVTVLHNFFGLDGSHPVGKLVLGPDGKLYGTTFRGGATTADAGTIFRISPAGVHETLHSFMNLDGRNPTSGVTLASNGDFWGTTLNGGSDDMGTVFRITPSGVFTHVHSFVLRPFSGLNTIHPYNGLLQGQDGNFYGVSEGQPGFAGRTLYRFSAGAAPLFITRLALFTSAFSPGVVPPGILQASDGQLYGGGCCQPLIGMPQGPQVFRSSTSGLLATVRETESLVSALTEGSDFALYGATRTGTLFRLETSGAYSEIKTMTELEGTTPSGVRAAGDWILGSTYGGGPAGGGVIFRFKRE